jgi:hypothetical protein
MRVRALLALAAGVAALAQVPAPRVPRAAPEQPLPFSHKTHAGQARIACAQCHPMPDPGDFATLPATEVCMTCHTAVKKDSPHIAKLAAAHAEGRRIRWAPVYRIPDWVSFNHKAHNATEGVSCATCHGPVAERDVLHQEKDLSMQACMDCHRAKGASNDCLLCHDQR